jgi:FtsP/CotA-like multicopper oxidase with cupredoxin domain
VRFAAQPGLMAMDRRRFLLLGSGAASAVWLPEFDLAASTRAAEFELEAASGRVSLVGAGYPDTAVFAYGGSVPGPVLRARQGQRLRVRVRNSLQQPTTVHWHGIRLPNAMDGVPHLTQAPIPPGGSFVYEFDPPDAGTFWYHPHANSSEQLGRGLYGALIVEEPTSSVPVGGGVGFDRELIWILDDWRLDKDAAIQPFGNGHDSSHAGRIGNVVTINGSLPDPLRVTSGERLRLRLINAANARHFSLLFESHSPLVIAVDGQPTAPHAPEEDRVVLAPGMRVDLQLDMASHPGDKARVIDTFYRDAYLLNEFIYSDRPPLRTAFPEAVALPANPVPAPDMVNAERHEILFAGGAMGGMPGALLNGRWTDIRSMARSGVVWAVNGVAATGHVLDPLLTLRRGKSYVFALENDTAFPHPIHLHGHHFRVVGREGRPTSSGVWRDTVLLRARERAEIAFVADNPGDWMLHCHVPEHMEAGMMGVVRVV